MKAMTLVNSKAERNSLLLQVRDPYTFEFLGLQAKDVVTESDIEEALLGHLQEFLQEMGKGFCFEARQKRIIIDGEYYFADLVFYNRLLHCNVIVELKNDEFRHEHIGQLNAYVSYYAENEMQPGDNPPVGILLCTRKGKRWWNTPLATWTTTSCIDVPVTASRSPAIGAIYHGRVWKSAVKGCFGIEYYFYSNKFRSGTPLKDAYRDRTFIVYGFMEYV